MPKIEAKALKRTIGRVRRYFAALLIDHTSARLSSAERRSGGSGMNRFAEVNIVVLHGHQMVTHEANASCGAIALSSEIAALKPGGSAGETALIGTGVHAGLNILLVGRSNDAAI